MVRYGFYFPGQIKFTGRTYPHINANGESINTTMVINAKDEAEALQEFNKYQQRFGEGEFLGPLKAEDIQYNINPPVYKRRVAPYNPNLPVYKGGVATYNPYDRLPQMNEYVPAIAERLTRMNPAGTAYLPQNLARRNPTGTSYLPEIDLEDLDYNTLLPQSSLRKSQ